MTDIHDPDIIQEMPLELQLELQLEQQLEQKHKQINDRVSQKIANMHMIALTIADEKNKNVEKIKAIRIKKIETLKEMYPVSPTEELNSHELRYLCEIVNKCTLDITHEMNKIEKLEYNLKQVNKMTMEYCNLEFCDLGSGESDDEESDDGEYDDGESYVEESYVEEYYVENLIN